jgi:hypothetical protein
MHPDFAFKERVKWSEGVQEKVAVVGRGGGGGSKKMEWGAWFELIDQDQDIRNNASLIPFFGTSSSLHNTGIAKLKLLSCGSYSRYVYEWTRNSSFR